MPRRSSPSSSDSGAPDAGSGTERTGDGPPSVGLDADAPRCPSCGYLLTGLAARVCPECGERLEDDFSRYRPSAAATPWSAAAPRPLWRGIGLVLLRPGLAFDRLRRPSDCAARRCIAFAVLLSMFVVLGWGLLREIVVVILVWEQADLAAAVSAFQYALHNGLFQRSFWTRLMIWESWSLSRLWVLFGAIAVLGGVVRGDVGMSLRRLLIFTPWLIVLEIAFLVAGTFLCDCVPEPSTLFFPFWSCLEGKTLVDPFWLKRALVPSLVVGWLFFRYVLCCRWRSALPLGLLVYPLLVYVTVVWSTLYSEGFLRQIR